VDGRSKGHPRTRAPGGGARAGGDGARRRAGFRSPATSTQGVPGHENARKRHLGEAENIANSNACLHGWKKATAEAGIHGGGRPAAGQAAAAL
jgi:hypothetical protein